MSAKTEIFDAMADQIADALSGSSLDIQVRGRMVLNPSGLYIDMQPGSPATSEETAAMGADLADMGAGYIVDVRARVAPLDFESVQDVLIDLTDPEHDLCLVQAIYDDPTLGGHASDVNLVSESGFTMFSDIDPAKVYIGVLWRFLVIPDRS